MLLRFLGYFSYLQRQFGLWGALSFMFFYLVARGLGDRPGRVHRIPVGPYVCYFPLVTFFAGLFTEIFFNEEYYLEKTDTPIRVIDGGANIGISLLYIKLQAPNARVTCFEPNPAAQEVLQKNIDANGWRESVTIVGSALGAKVGAADFFLSADTDTDSSGTLTKKQNPKNTQRSFIVSVEPLSQYLTKPLDLLKLDIEGAEYAVIAELQATGRLSLIKQIQLEYHDAPLATHPLSDMLHLLEREGFKTAVRSTVSARDLLARNWQRNCIVYAWK